LFGEELLKRIQVVMQDNVFLYVGFVILCYVVGGIDESLAIFAVLNAISLGLAVCKMLGCADFNHLKKAVVRLVHNLIVIIICVAIDKTLRLDATKLISLRNYALIYLSHSEVVSIYVIITKQGANIPTLLRRFVKMLKNKNKGDDSDE
jgi:phage-related holin